MTLAEGDEATCTITNTAVAGVWELTKLADPVSGSTVAPGSVIKYTLVAAHESGAPIEGATASDDMSKVLPYATVDQPLPAGLTLSGNTLTWAVPTIPVGGSVEVTYSVTVKPDVHGVTVFNIATPTSPGGHCTPCETTHDVSQQTVVPPPPTNPEIPTTGRDFSTPLRWAGWALIAGGLFSLAGTRRRARTIRTT